MQINFLYTYIDQFTLKKTLKHEHILCRIVFHFVCIKNEIQIYVKCMNTKQQMH